MNFKDNIPHNEEKQWASYLNGEPDILEHCDLDETKKQGLTDVWEATGNNYSFSAADPDKGWRKLQAKIEKSEKKLKIKVFKSSFFKYAATIVMFLGIGFGTWQILKSPEIVADIPVHMAFAETDAHPVTVTRVTLPDGSTVKLNANTRIEYPERFAGSIRKVKLSGEAFFEVTKDSIHPFRIETTIASVEVIGTSFNVSAYPDADRVEVNVETGKVKLSQIGKVGLDPKFTVLPAGKRGWLTVSDGAIGHEERLAPNYASWITKVISFQRTPLAEVCAVLENTYHIKIRLADSESGKIPYTANFANLNSDYIIEVIARTHHLHVKKNEDEIILTKRAN